MNPTNAFAPAPIKPIISPDVLESIDIRVGTIERVEDVAKSNKLMKLTVNFGDHTRSILAGIKKERSDPQEIEANRRSSSSIWRRKRSQAKPPKA
jgi:tRNA-binding protein